ncbi:MAG: ArsR/SmtB family transcription factor [Candidatus Bathyarchaeia archaeon]
MKKGLTNLCYGFFSTLANPTRLAIIERLDEQPMSVNKLAASLGQEQSMVSHNLRPLLRCNLVHVRREGKHRIYRLNKETLTPILETIKTHAETYCKNTDCPFKNRSENLGG